MSLLELDHVTIRYGQEAPVWRRRPGSDLRPAAVSEATFRVQKGEALGIVGESGSGKTTIMRAVMGFVPVDEGEIRFDGEVLGPHRSTASRRAIQMVFQDPGTTLNPTRRVGDAIEELLRVHRIVPAGSRQARVRELFDRVRLPSSVYRAYPRELSGGQKQRVAIARSLALEPQILIADEATSALDVIVQASVLELLQELRADSDITLISIAHDLNLVRYLCDRAIVMNGGRIVESGPVDRLFDHPEEPYTRELIDASPQLPDFARMESR